MVKTVENVVVIPQEYEVWEGVKSLDRVRELLSVGLTKRAVAKRFKVSVQSIDKALAKEKGGGRQDTPPNDDPEAAVAETDSTRPAPGAQPAPDGGK